MPGRLHLAGQPSVIVGEDIVPASAGGLKGRLYKLTAVAAGLHAKQILFFLCDSPVEMPDVPPSPSLGSVCERSVATARKNQSCVFFPLFNAFDPMHATPAKNIIRTQSPVSANTDLLIKSSELRQ